MVLYYTKFIPVYNWLKEGYIRIFYCCSSQSSFDKSPCGPCRLMIWKVSVQASELDRGRAPPSKRASGRWSWSRSLWLLTLSCFNEGNRQHITRLFCLEKRASCICNVTDYPLQKMSELPEMCHYCFSATAGAMVLVFLWCHFVVVVVLRPLPLLAACAFMCLYVITGCGFPLLLAPGEHHTCYSLRSTNAVWEHWFFFSWSCSWSQKSPDCSANLSNGFSTFTFAFC